MSTQVNDNSQKGLVLAAGVLALMLGIVFDQFFYAQAIGAAYPVFIALVILCGRFLAIKSGSNLSVRAWLLIAATLFFAIMIAVRTSEMIILLDLFATIYLLVWLIRAINEPTPEKNPLTYHILMLFEVPLKFLIEFPSIVGKIYRQVSIVNVGEKHAPVIRGVVIAIPVLVLFVILFSSADIVFNKYFDELFNFKIDESIIFRTFVVASVTSVFLGAFGYLIRAKEPPGSNVLHTPIPTPSPAGTHAPARSAGLIESIIVLSSVCFLFLIFIVIQIAYLFGGQENITKLGYTYAEYARRGFFELMGVAVIAFLLVWTFEKIAARAKWRDNLVFRLLSFAFISEVMLIIASSFKRLALYESAYGFTELRLFSHIFTIWLAIVFLLLLYKIMSDWREVRFVTSCIVSIFVVIAGMNIMNLDDFIVKKNLQRMERTGDLDLAYLATLSSDAAPALEATLTLKDPKLREEAADRLFLIYDELRGYRDTSWHSYNASRQRALEVLIAHEKLLEEHKDHTPEPFRLEDF